MGKGRLVAIARVSRSSEDVGKLKMGVVDVGIGRLTGGITR